MITAELDRLVPLFIRNDRNGHAMAAALQRGLEIFCSTVQDGIDLILNVDKMPEWRLDELAEEMGCVYDKTAAADWKREWLKNAYKFSTHLGTPAAVAEYLGSRLENIRVEEYWKYGGQPYHFRITADNLTPEKIRWAAAAAEKVKNLRSIFDGTEEASGVMIEMTADTDKRYYTTAKAGESLHTGDEYKYAEVK